VRLADHTTLRLGGPARRFVRAGTEADLIDAVRAADRAGEPLLILGGGSNLVVADRGFDGTVIQVATTGVHQGGGPRGSGGKGFSPKGGLGGWVPPGEKAGGVRRGSLPPGQHSLVTVSAGEDWDAVVAWTVAAGLAGLECLSGIPGLAGATPIQNVGAYGQEVADTITTVRTYDRVTGEIDIFLNDRCGFGYRTSVFKRDDARRYVVLSVTFRLAEQSASMPLRYPELASALGVEPGDQVASTEVRSAVIDLRRSKGMVIDSTDPDTRSVGSFFVNPVLDGTELAAVEAAARARCGAGTRVPRFDAGDGLVKVPAAWLIEQTGFGKGYSLGDGARISSKHTLALVNSGSASTAGLIALAREIRDGVRDAFGVSLAPEPVLVGVTL
jgi:UDP-N-acetylmuramate dehydrogenase